ncbi:MAG: hypothetical protein NTU43_08765 [Bacteroidetes bacterium]|nr:hypothetical protein [Bacteroidota bacterium]
MGENVFTKGILFETYGAKSITKGVGCKTKGEKVFSIGEKVWSVSANKKTTSIYGVGFTCNAVSCGLWAVGCHIVLLSKCNKWVLIFPNKLLS